MKDQRAQSSDGRSDASTRKTPAKQISLKELAALVALSPSTVSRVVSGGRDAHRISPETRKRVLAAAEKHHYTVNTLAKSLRMKVSYTIGVIVPEISEGYSTAVLGGIEEELLKSGYFYFVVSHRHREELLRAYPRMMLSRSVDGIIAIDTPLAEQMPVPVVSVSGHSRPEDDARIELDHLHAARLALSHLKELGHRQIAFVKGQEFSSDTAQRWKAICTVAKSLGLEIDPDLVVQMQSEMPGTTPGYEAAIELLKHSRSFTAVFTFNDLAAIGTIQALREKGLNIPNDVSVLGFDDILSAATTNPPLTTIHQPLRSMGRMAAATMLQMIRSGTLPLHKPAMAVHPKLVVRGSTGPARDASLGAQTSSH